MKKHQNWYLTETINHTLLKFSAIHLLQIAFRTGHSISEIYFHMLSIIKSKELASDIGWRRSVGVFNDLNKRLRNNSARKTQTSTSRVTYELLSSTLVPPTAGRSFGLDITNKERFFSKSPQNKRTKKRNDEFSPVFSFPRITKSWSAVLFSIYMSTLELFATGMQNVRLSIEIGLFEDSCFETCGRAYFEMISWRESEDMDK